MSMKLTGLSQRRNAPGNRARSVAVAVALALPVTAGAFEFDTGNEQLSIRFDNTVRFNVMSRVADEDEAMLANWNTDDGARNFPQGSVFTRLDLLTEFDFVWKRSTGFRVSAASWWDAGYDALDNGSVATSNNLENGLPVLGLDDHTKRYAEGPSGEFLDAFAFARFDVGGAPVNLKVGQTTVFWGESLLFNGAIHGVSYSQNPIDVWKGLATPGAEAKELFRPRVGFNVQSTVTDTLSIAAQYFFNWQSFDNQAWRYPESGSYLTINDALLYGGDSYIVGRNPFAASVAGAPAFLRAWRGQDIEPEENSGNYGLAVRWSPQWLDGTVGAYYRRTYDMQPQLMLTPGLIPGLALPPDQCTAVGGSPLPGNNCIVNKQATTAQDLLAKGRLGEYNVSYGEDIDIFGLSLSKQVAGISLGAELSYRQGMPLLSEPVQVLPDWMFAAKKAPAGAIAVSEVPRHGTPGAAGDTMHGLVNVLGLVGDTPVFDAATWSTELTWMTWLDVTQNEAVFKGRGNDKNGRWAAYQLIDAVDKNYFGLAVNITPTWYQVLPGMDLLAPLSWSQGISGNSAVSAGGQEDAGSFGIGIAADFYQKYRFDLKYVGFYGDYSTCPRANVAAQPGNCSLNNGSVDVYNGTNAIISDRDFISLTFKTTF
jgi:hypothetical protein